MPKAIAAHVPVEDSQSALATTHHHVKHDEWSAYGEGLKIVANRR